METKNEELKKISQLQNQINEQKEEINYLKSIIKALESEKKDFLELRSLIIGNNEPLKKNIKNFINENKIFMLNYYIEKQEMEKVLMISITIVMEKKILQL